jgi:hypothetical protein
MNMRDFFLARRWASGSSFGGGTGGGDIPDIPDTPEVNPLTFGTDGVARFNTDAVGFMVMEVHYQLHKVDGRSAVPVGDKYADVDMHDFSGAIAYSGDGDYFVTCEVYNEDYQYRGSYTSETVTFGGDNGGGDDSGNGDNGGGDESGNGDNGGNDGNWLFKDEILTNSSRSDLPATEAGTSYTLFVDGVEIATATAEEWGITLSNSYGSVWVNYDNSFGESGWYFHPIESEGMSGSVSIRING